MMRPIGCPDISVRNYHYSLHNNPKELSSQLLRGGSLKSRKIRRILITEKTNSRIHVKLCIISSFYDSPNLNILG
jgi:hypothetical protein